jgi:protocatechuate 3,4-dioxygenase, beta subunit
MEDTVASSPTRSRTPGLLLGPFYPVEHDPAAGERLWHGSTLQRPARALRLDATMLNLWGQPVCGALVEIWHADELGRYRHSSAPGQGAVTLGFAGYGRTLSDARGELAFDSIVPGPYSDGVAERAPHIHFQITGQIDRLVTQMFLRSDPPTRNDRWYRAVAAPDRLLPTIVADEPGRLHLHWTVVLANG